MLDAGLVGVTIIAGMFLLPALAFLGVVAWLDRRRRRTPAADFLRRAQGNPAFRAMIERLADE